MKILLVGAGAVGQVYGRHLAKSGADISFFIREKYVEECRQGFSFYPLNSFRRAREPIVWSDYSLITTINEVSQTQWDQIWLCVSSTAIRGEWFGELLSHAGKATVVSLQPGLEDRQLILNHVAEERLIQGMIGFISYPGPLTGEVLPSPGMAYWFPPPSPSLFSGPNTRLDTLLGLLRKGRLPAKGHPDITTFVGFPTAMMMPVLVGLESEGWSFEKFRTSSVLNLVCRAVEQAMPIVAQKTGGKQPVARFFFRPWLLKILSVIAPKLMPLPIETYLKYHFTKVGDQTRLIVETYESLGNRFGLPTDAIKELRGLVA